MSKSFLKEAERNVINQAKLLQETIDYLDVLRNASYKIFDANFNHTDKHNAMFLEGLNLMRQAVYAKHCENIARCFDLVGVGGEEAIEFCKKRAEERFKENQLCVLQYLHKHGHVPSWAKTDDIEKLKEEIVEKMRK